MADEDNRVTLAEFIARQLWPDIRTGAVHLARKLTIPYKKATCKVYPSPSVLLQALKTNEVSAGEWVTLECKPSSFGPFLRDHFMSPVIGHHSEMRLGPRLQSGNDIMDMLHHVTSHLKPVGIYPPISDDMYQVCLYPSDVNAYGFIGMMPGLDKVVEYMPAISNASNIRFNNVPCNVTGIVRMIEPDLLIDIGLPIEKWEELRQSGDIWFIDLTDDYSDVNPLGDAVTTEIWGGLYASGHYEIAEGNLLVNPLVDGMAEAIRAQGITPHVTQNTAKARGEFLVYGKGIRAIVDSTSPIFSLHMDAELALEYANSRKKFDLVMASYLSAVEETATISSAEVTNLHDLDFTYTDSAKAYSVLRSQSADKIADPLGVAMRDWHRKRNN